MKLFLKSTKKNYYAECEYCNNSYVVKKGAIVVEDISYPKITKEALTYRKDKSLFKDKVTNKDITFKSATAAAQFITGQSLNGMKVWKTEDGKSLNDLKKK